VQIIEGVRKLQSPFSSSALTIGSFDGVHLGHQALIRRVVARARALGVPAVVMTFEPHPVQVLFPDRKLQRIFDFEDQREQLARLGVDVLVIEPFSREFSELPPERYLSEWVYEPFHPQALVVGYDFSFGAHRRGSIASLREKAPAYGFEVEVVEPVKLGDITVSSTRIRQALAEGDVALVKRLLGRPFYLKGIVEKGAGRGRTIGIPTANLRTPAELVPARGVYCGWAEIRGKKEKALINIGLNPTFTDGLAPTPTIEAHLPDFAPAGGEAATFYGENLSLEFVSRLRDERKFASAAELVAQIHSDIAEGKRILDVER
jgi:riboflavin kinase/FMN adenylyltransferase